MSANKEQNTSRKEYDPLLPPIDPTSYATHTSAAFGFALLFGTFALAELDIPIHAAGIVLAIVVAAICLACIFDEILKYVTENNKNHTHLLKIAAFVAAMFGCILASAEIMNNTFSASWVSAVPAGLFILATTLLALSALIDSQTQYTEAKKTHWFKVFLFFVELLGAGALFTGALQDKEILKKTILPNIAIAAIASIAGIAALITIAVGWNQHYTALKTKTKSISESQKVVRTHTLHTMACFGFAALFFTFSLAQQGIAISAGGIILATAVAAICIGCAIDEGIRWHFEETSYEKHVTHLLNILAFGAAAAGCALVGAELIDGLAFGSIPAGLFMVTTAFLSITSIIPMILDKQKRTTANTFKTVFFFLQFAGATALFSGALLNNPSTLGITITTAIAGSAAIGTILLGYVGYQAFNKSDEKEKSPLLKNQETIQPNISNLT